MPGPTLTGFVPSITFGENTVNSTPQVLDADVVFSDAEGDFDGGTLTLSGVLAEDRISVNNEGTDAGQIGLSGTDVTYGGVIIGTLSGGVGTSLTITFNAAATSAAIDALIQNLTYANVSDTPTPSRTLTLNVTDAEGGSLGTPAAFTGGNGPGSPFVGMSGGFASAPTLADLDGDGDLDVVIGEQNGSLLYFENTGTVSASVFTQRTGAANPFDGVDIGDFSVPTLADLDGDGDLDAVIGENYGTLVYFENTGTASAPVFAARTGAANPFNGVGIGGASAAAFADLDGDGDLDVVIGELSGVLNYFENTGTASAPVFAARTGAANPFDGVDVGLASTPTLGDVDGDGDIDAVFGAQNGTLIYFENTGTGLAPVFTQRTGAANPFNGVDVGTYSAPVLIDFDGDGDLDAAVGENVVGLHYFENALVRPPSVAVSVTAEADASSGNDTLSGAGNIDGLAGDDVIAGAAGDQTLDGGEGIDTVSYADAVAGVVVRLNRNSATDGSGGIDTLNNFENVTGSAFADILVGREGGDSVISGGLGADTLLGRDGNDTLIGGTGAANALYGGTGNDLYIVSANDTLVENADAGTDTVQTARANLTLRANLENLTYTGASSFAGRGNDLANVITGGAAADVLSGLGGNDTLIGGAGAANTLVGGAGDNSYVVSTRDTIVEAASEGTDTVNVSLNYYGLATNVENLAFTGTGAFSGFGNASANIITGGTGADTLRGAGGDDTLNGGDGFDTADFLGTALEYLIEDLGGGQYRVTDTVDGRDGVDILNGMEQARFSDSRVVLSTISPDVFPELSQKDAGAQVLPGVIDDDFLFRETDLPLILPGAVVDDLLTIAGVLTPDERPDFMLAVGEAGLIDHGGSVYDPGHDYWIV